jgi:hypothetical protein
LEGSALRIQSDIDELIAEDCRFSAAAFLAYREGKMKFLNFVYPRAKIGTKRLFSYVRGLLKRKRLSVDQSIPVPLLARVCVELDKDVKFRFTILAYSRH